MKIKRTLINQIIKYLFNCLIKIKNDASFPKYKKLYNNIPKMITNHSRIEEMDLAGAKLYKTANQIQLEEQKKKDDDVANQRIEEDKMFPKLTKLYHTSILNLLSSKYLSTEIYYLKTEFTNQNLDYSAQNIFRRWFTHMCDKDSRFLSLPNGTLLEPITCISFEFIEAERNLLSVIFTSLKNAKKD